MCIANNSSLKNSAFRFTMSAVLQELGLNIYLSTTINEDNMLKVKWWLRVGMGGWLGTLWWKHKFTNYEDQR